MRNMIEGTLLMAVKIAKKKGVFAESVGWKGRDGRKQHSRHG